MRWASLRPASTYKVLSVPIPFVGTRGREPSCAWGQPAAQMLGFPSPPQCEPAPSPTSTTERSDTSRNVGKGGVSVCVFFLVHGKVACANIFKFSTWTPVCLKIQLGPACSNDVGNYHHCRHVQGVRGGIKRALSKKPTCWFVFVRCMDPSIRSASDSSRYILPMGPRDLQDTAGSVVKNSHAWSVNY